MSLFYSEFRRDDLNNAAQAVKAGATRLFELIVTNPNAAYPIYVKIYKAAAADVTVGTTIPERTYPVPAGGVLILENNGVKRHTFDPACSVAATKFLADDDATALAAPAHIQMSYL